MFILDFDIIGTLIFLWFIFKGIRDSQEAKKKHAQRQKTQKAGHHPRTSRRKSRELEPVKPVPPVFPTFEPEPVPPLVTYKEKPEIITQVSPKEVIKKKQQDFIEKNRQITVEDLEQEDFKTTLSLESQAVIEGIIWSEILGPPRAKKKHRPGIY